MPGTFVWECKHGEENRSAPLSDDMRNSVDCSRCGRETQFDYPAMLGQQINRQALDLEN